MRHHISRHVAAQPGTSRLSMPPARASSGASAAQNVHSPSPAQPVFIGFNPANQVPLHNHVVQAPTVQPSTLHSPVTVPVAPGAAHPINGAALPVNAPQAHANDLAGMEISEFNQRVLKDYLATMQSQLVAMNQVVAAAVAQNQALTAQNQALFEELRSLKQHVQTFASVGSANNATAVVASVTASAPVTSHETLELMAEPGPMVNIPTAYDHGLAKDAAAESLQRPGPPAPKPVVRPEAEATQLQHQPDKAAVPTTLSAAAEVGPLASDDDTRLQILSLVALELAGFGEVRSLEGGGVTQATQGPTDRVEAAAASPVSSGSMSGQAAAPERSLTPTSITTSFSDSTKPSVPGLATLADKPSEVELTAPMADVAPSQPQQASRPPGRGGRYVGPPRAGPYARTAQNAGVGTSSWPDVVPAAGTQLINDSAGAESTCAGSGAPDNKISAYATNSYQVGNSGRGGWRVGSGSAAAKPPTTVIPGDRGSNVVSKLQANADGTAAAAAVEPAGTAGAVSASSQTEKRIRLSSTANELRAIVEGNRLSPQQAVLVAQQLPRIARLAQERQQELLLEDATVGNSAESEVQILRELFLRLLTRFSSPGALSSLRAAFLPNYVALAFVSRELHQAPSRAFAGALRQLVTQHVTEVAPEVAAAAVAAVAQLDGTVAPGVLERSCKVVTEGKLRLVGWKALVAAGHLAPLGPTALDVALQVLNGAQVACAASAAGDAPANLGAEASGDLDGEALLTAAQCVLACSAVGVAVPSVLLHPLEAASRREGVLAVVGPSGQLLVAQAFVATGHQPEAAWLHVWEEEVVASLTRASPIQVATLAGVLHTLTRAGTANGSGQSRYRFVAAASERLLASGSGAGVTSGASACALARHIGELAAGGSNGTTIAAAPPSITRQLAEALLRVAKASLASLDMPDLAALVSGLSLLDVRAPADVWSALLSRTTDAPVAAAAVTSAARHAMELGLPGGINPASLEHFLSVGSKHVGELPAASLLGLLGLATAVNGKLRPGLAASVLTRLYEQAATMGPRDAAFAFAAVDGLSLPLTQPFAARPLVAAGDKKNDGNDAATALTPATVLRRIAEAALMPEEVLAALGLERTAQFLELVARLQQASAASTAPMAIESGTSASLSAVMDEDDSLAAEIGCSGRDGSEGHRLVPSALLLTLLGRVQSLLPEASPQALAALVSSAAALNLSVPPDWLAAVVASTRSLMPLLGPMTWSRIAAALTRCEQLAGLAPGSAGDAEGNSWMDAFMDDIQRKLPAAPPAALAQTLQVLVAHGKQPSASWTTDFLGAAMTWLEAPLPLTQAQAAGVAAVAASFAAGRARPAGRNASVPASSSAPRPGVALATPSLPGQLSDSGIARVQGPTASAFTPPQLAELLGALASLKLKQYITPRWLTAAVRQVEGCAVHFTYRDLAEALYGISRLGGVVRDIVCNQLFIVSLAKLSTAPPRLLARTLAVASAVEGRKLSSKWWAEAERALVARLGDVGAFKVTKTADGGTSCAWQTSDLCLIVESVLALHRDKDEMKISASLAGALATVVAHGSDGVMAAALPLEVAISYVETCGQMRQLGRPPLDLLERYLSYSIHRLAALTDDSPSAALNELAKAHQKVESSGTGKGKAREKREQKRARERVAKQAGGGVTSPLVQHLQTAVGVGKMLVGTPDSERLTAASPWLEALVAAGAVAAPMLPPSSAADVLWLIAKLERGSGATTGAAERTAEWWAQVEALATRVCASADAVPPANAHAGRVRRSVLGPDAVVETVWALQTLGFRPTEGLLYDLACVLPRRLAAMAPAEVLPLLTALADAGAVGARTVAEANSTAIAASVSGKVAAADSVGAATAPVKLATELGRYLDKHMSALFDNQLVEALAASAILGIKLPSTVINVAGARLSEAAALGMLRGGSLFDAVQSLCRQGAMLPADQLEPLCDAVAEGALDGTLGGTFQIAQVAASLYDMGARPGPEWLAMMSEGVLDDFGFSVSSHGSIRRPPLTARGLVISLYELSTRFEANYVTLAMEACRAAMEDLEGQLDAAEGRLVSQPLQQRPEWGWRVPSTTDAWNPSDAAATSVQLDQKQQLAAYNQLQQQPREEQGEEEIEVVTEEEVIALDPELLQPLGLGDVVLLLKGLIEARQEPPPAMWELVERALRPALQRQQQPLVSGGDDESIQLQISDDDLSGLLTQMQRLNAFASTTFLQDLEGYLGRRMPLQGHLLLAAFASHCTIGSYNPDSKFMCLFRRRVEDVLADIDTHSALLLIQFLLVEAFEKARKTSERSVDADRAQEKHKKLLQSLLERTEGKDLLSFATVAEDDTRSVSILMISLIHSFGLRLPHANSPERQTVWLIALQALTKDCMDHVGWHNVAELLRMIYGSGHVPQPEWLSALYKGLEAAADTASPHDVAEAALAIASANFQPALAPMLPAKLAGVLERRMREFASTDSRVIAHLLHAVGVMGHTVRTEVLQASEMLLAAPLARAPEVLQETHEALAKSSLKPPAPESEAEARLIATLEAAQELLRQDNLLGVCMALKVHGYRPSPTLAAALMDAAMVLHRGTHLLLQEMENQGWRNRPSSPLVWSDLMCLGGVLSALADWGIQPTEPWLHGAAMALPAVSILAEPANPRQELVDAQLGAILNAVAALEGWGHQLSEPEVMALQRAVEERVEVCNNYDCEVDEELVRLLCNGLEDRLAKNRERHAGASMVEARSPAPPLRSAWRAVEPSRQVADSATRAYAGSAGPAAAPASRPGIELSDINLVEAAGAYAAGRKVRAGFQQGPVAPAEYQDLRPDLNRDDGERVFSQATVDVKEPLHQQVGGGFVPAAEAATAIAAALQVPELKPQVPVATTSGGILAEPTMAIAGEPEAAAAFVSAPQALPVAPAPTAVASALEPPSPQVGERPAAEAAQTRTIANVTPVTSASGPAMVKDSKAEGSQSSESGVDAPSTRVSFRRLTPVERAAAGTRSAPPVPLSGEGAKERTRTAISQLLQIMPKSSRPPRVAAKLARADDDDDYDTEAEKERDEATAAASAACNVSRLAAAAASRVSAAAAANNSAVRGSSATAGRSSGRRVRASGQPQGGVARRADATTTAAVVTTPAAICGPAGKGSAPLDPSDPSSWNLLDREIDVGMGSGTAQQEAGRGALPVVEAEVLEP